MDNWQYFNNWSGNEFNSECRIFKEIQGGRFDNFSKKEILVYETPCRIAENSEQKSDFASTAQYVLSIPYEENITPKMYVGYGVKIKTINEVIKGEISVVLPVSQLRKVQMYIKREVWNIVNKDGDPIDTSYELQEYQ